MSSDGATAAVLLSASHLGFALSTTHVATGSVLGGGLGRGTPVRWSTAGRMVTAWATTFPIAALVGALMWWIGDSIGGAVGAIVVFLILVAFSTWIFRSSRREHVGADNVNDEWDRAAEITSPAYEHARRSPTPPNGSGPRAPRCRDPATAEPTAPTPTPPTATRRAHRDQDPLRTVAVNNVKLVLEGASEVLFAGLVFGAGLPFVYAVALRVLTIGATTYADADGDDPQHPAHRPAACSPGCSSPSSSPASSLGLMIIVATGFGKEVSFDNIYPTIVDK